MRPRPPCPLPEDQGLTTPAAGSGGRPHAPLTREEAISLAARCLCLNICQGCELCQLLCPDQAISKDPVTQRPVIDLDYCKGCGLCAHVCPKGAIHMEAE